MSWKDEEIDALFKSAKAPEAPAFQDDFWKEMEALLPEKKKRLAAFWWISGAASLVLVLMGILAYTFSGARSEQLTAQHQRIKSADKPQAEQLQKASAKVVDPTGDQEMEQTASGAQIIAPANGRSTKSGTGGSTSSEQVSGDLPPKGPDLTVVTTEASAPVVLTEAVDRLSKWPLTADAEIASFNSWTGTELILLPKPERFYVQLSAGLGQSAQRNVAGHSELMQSYAFGGGLIQNVRKMYVTFGLQGRVDVAQNIFYQSLPAMDLSYTDTRYSCLYSFETPLAIGYRLHKNRFGITMTPGFQSGFTGRYTEYDSDNSVVRSGKAQGRTAQSKTLTMEFGLSYMRELRSRWYIGCSVNADVIRPFGEGSYLGEQRVLPVNGTVLLRRTF